MTKKYLLISNKGLLDITLLKLIGASTKTADSSKIGQFGTGLKYAISYLLRNGNKLRIFIGSKEVKFTLKTITAKEQEFKEIFCNGESMNITTHYGYQWQAWEALREIWCNAIDEVEPLKKIIDKENAKLTGKAGYTRIYIEIDEKIQDVLTNWESYFISKEPLYTDENLSIYLNREGALKVYKNHVLVEGNSYYNSIFTYDFKNCNLNELRQYQGYVNSDIASALLNSNQAVVKIYLEALNDYKMKDVIEKSSLSFKYQTYDTKRVKKIFQGYVFLHPDSQKETSAKVVKVPFDLYEILQKCGLPCEHIRNSSSGGYYGGSGRGYSEKSISYKIVKEDRFEKRVKTIMKDLNAEMDFKIAVSLKDNFEFIQDNRELILNLDLDKLSDADLQAVIMIGLLHKQESNMYNVLKRLIKISMRLKNFKKILFG